MGSQAEEHDELEVEVPSIQKDIVHKEKKLTALQDKRGHIQEDIAELQTKLSEARQQGGNDARQRTEVFHYIMNHLKKKNIVKGIIGRLGDLGGINKKYDVAIS